MLSAVLHGSVQGMETVYYHVQKDHNGANFPWFKFTFNKAVHGGTSIEKMRFMRDKGCPFGDRTLNMAVINGSLENIVWLKSVGCKFSDDTFSIASKAGSLPIMQWLLSEECGFGPTTFSEAASNGDLRNMIWLKSVGCSFDKRTLLEADRNGSEDNKFWLAVHGCKRYDSPMDIASFEIDDFIRDNSPIVY